MRWRRNAKEACVKVIHYLLAMIAFGALAVDAGFAERPGLPKRPPIAGLAKKSNAASTVGPPRNGIAASASGHARNRRQDFGLQAIGGPARNAIGLRVKNDTTAGGRGPGPAASGVTTMHLPTVDTPGTGRPTSGRAAIARPAAPAVGGMASVSLLNAAPGPGGNAAGIRGGISGTGVVRIGSGPAVLGGPTVKSASINGTSMRLKH